MNEARFQRHSLIDWFDQNQVVSCSVLVIGAGAIGNEVLKNLCLLGVGAIHIIDFDNIEEHNLTRTVLFRESDLGYSKAEVAAKACRELNPEAKISFKNGNFWDHLTISQLKQFDAALCCVDNLEARIRLNTLCMIAGTPLINGAIDSRHLSVQFFPFGSEETTACYECWLPPSAYATMRKRYSCGWLKKVAFEEKKIPTTAVTASIAGAQMVSLLLQDLCGHPSRPSGPVQFSLDTVTMAGGLLSIERSPECTTCSQWARGARAYFAKRSVPPQRAFDELRLQADCQIQFSDPVIISVRCSICGNEEIICERAEKFDESLTMCVGCGKRSRAAHVIDAADVKELQGILGDRCLPVKFLHFREGEETIVIELEDTNG